MSPRYDRDQILDMWAAGQSSYAIAEEIGITDANVRYVVRSARKSGDARATEHEGGCNVEARQFWADHDAELRQLVSEKLSASQVAVRLGVTRNAVIGRLSRIGLSLLGKSGRPRLAERGRQAMRRAYVKRIAPTRVRPSRHPIAGPAPAPTCEPVTMSMLKTESCRYIEGNPDGEATLYCGSTEKPAHRPDSPYCPHHHARCYEPLNERRRDSADRYIERVAA